MKNRFIALVILLVANGAYSITADEVGHLVTTEPAGDGVKVTISNARADYSIRFQHHILNQALRLSPAQILEDKWEQGLPTSSLGANESKAIDYQPKNVTDFLRIYLNFLPTIVGSKAQGFTCDIWKSKTYSVFGLVEWKKSCSEYISSMTGEPRAFKF